MPLPAPPRWKTVRKILADGTVKEYRYRRADPRAPRLEADSVGELLRQFQASPEWLALQPTTQQNYTIYLRHIAALRAIPIGAIKRRNLLTLRDAVAASHGPGAATGFVRAIKAFFRWCRDRDWIDVSPAHEVRPLPGGHLLAWTQAQADLAMRILPEPLRRVVVLGMHTGQRRGDLIAMRWSAYDGAVIRLRQQKTGAELVVPCHRDLRAELDAWRSGDVASLDSRPVLTMANGRPWKPTTLSHALTTALQHAGMPAGLNVHGLRKLAAVRLAEAGCSTLEIGAITGHRTLSMIALYTASSDQQRLAEAAIVRLETGRATWKHNPGKLVKSGS